MAMFIRVDIDDSVQQDADLKQQLVEVCPVDIFAIVESGVDSGVETGHVRTVEDNLDECTLCDLCIDAAGDRVAVVKLYRQ